MTRIRIGVPQSLSVRPLIYGLVRSPQPGVELMYDQPGCLASRLERRELDVALIPSIEYVRGVGAAYLEGPAHVARPGGNGLLLVSRVPLASIERIAVNEFCRSPIAATRVVLDRLHGVRPDMLVEKNFGGDWSEKYDAILLNGDSALDLVVHGHPADLEVHSVVEMWTQVTGYPLPLGLWAFNDLELQSTFAKWLITSRNLGVQNLSRLADGIATTSHYGSEVLYEYFNHSWTYNLGEDELAGLHALEELSMEYDLVLEGRLVKAPVG